jgi:hypothetical protein
MWGRRLPAPIRAATLSRLLKNGLGRISALFPSLPSEAV